MYNVWYLLQIQADLMQGFCHYSSPSTNHVISRSLPARPLALMPMAGCTEERLLVQ